MSDDINSSPQARRASYTLHSISHVRWQRETGSSSQAALQLTMLLDNVLALMDSDARYRAFLLDGQTILIEDYLALRPERFETIERLVQSGQLALGPWYVQPDFLIASAESHIRNLLLGTRTARVFGASLAIGYMPGGSGHIGQMPQILRGFQIDSAVIVRGLGDDPAELTWEAPDGSRVLAAYLRESDDALAHLPIHLPDAITAIGRVRERLAPHTASGHLPIFSAASGLDPIRHLPDALAAANSALIDSVFHSTLTAYMDAMRADVAGRELPIVRGELRRPERYALSTGGLSARLWIKQRNHAAETLLTRWVEPFTAWAEAIDAQPQRMARLRQPQIAIERAWRRLLENQTPETLGGFVSDALCAEISTRFDQVMQIGEALAHSALQALADSIDTTSLTADGATLVIFNPSSQPRTDGVDSWLDLPGQFEDGADLIDTRGKVIPYTIDEPERAPDLAHLTLDREGLQSAQTAIQGGRLLSYTIGGVFMRRDLLYPDTVQVIVTVYASDEQTEASTAAVEHFLQILQAVRADESIQSIDLHFRRPMRYHLRFIAYEVPPFGYVSYGLTRTGRIASPVTLAELSDAGRADFSLENESVRVTLDPQLLTLTLFDRVRGLSYSGLFDLRCEGDQGDARNFSPTGRAIQINQRLGSETRFTRESHAESLAYQVILVIDPTPEMTPSTARNVELTIDIMLTVYRDVPRVDMHITLHNTLANQRIRAHFQTPFAASTAQYDGHFEVVTRAGLDLPAISPPEGWAETPLGTSPQQAFVAVFAPQSSQDLPSEDERPGLIIANRGVREAEVLPNDQGSAEIAITLLRSISWLRRDDLLTRAPIAPQTMMPPVAMLGLEAMGAQIVELSLIPGVAGDYNQARAFSEGGLRAVVAAQHGQTVQHDESLAGMSALIRSSVPEFVISAIKLPADAQANGLIVRGYNASDDAVTVTLTPWRPFRYVDVVYIDESTSGGRLATEIDGAIEFKAAAHRILTFWFHV